METATLDSIPEGSNVDVLADMIDNLVALDVAMSRMAALRVQWIDGIRKLSEMQAESSPTSTVDSRGMAFRSIRAEVACALRLPERTVENLFGVAKMLCADLPATMASFSSGAISYRHAQLIVEHAAGLEPEALVTFERLVVPMAETSTPNILDRRAAKVRESLDPSSLEARVVLAVEKREVLWSADRDGMGWLNLYLEAADGMAIMTRVTDAALQLRAASDDPDARTLAQLRLDILRDVLMCGTWDCLGGKLVRPDVFVTVPVFSLMGSTSECGSLDGYGPIDADTARKLAASAPSFVRLLIHPETGVVLSVGKERYSPPADLRTAARVRDTTCRFPGCRRSAEFTDLDHTEDYGGPSGTGATELQNLAHLCRGHHTVKHHTPWKVKQHPGGEGTLTWTSPAGRDYITTPESRTQIPQVPEIAPF